MFGMSAERSEAQRPPRIDTGGTPALRFEFFFMRSSQGTVDIFVELY